MIERELRKLNLSVTIWIAVPALWIYGLTFPDETTIKLALLHIFTCITMLGTGANYQKILTELHKALDSNEDS